MVLRTMLTAAVALPLSGLSLLAVISALARTLPSD
jgi:hypothetical protein